MDSLNSILLVINILLMLLVVIAMGALKKYIDSVVELHDAVKNCFDVDDNLIKSIIESNNSVRAQCENTEKAYDLVMKQYESMQDNYKQVMDQYDYMYNICTKIIDNDIPDTDQINLKPVTDPIEIPTVPMLNVDFDAFKETRNALY